MTSLAIQEPSQVATAADRFVVALEAHRVAKTAARDAARAVVMEHCATAVAILWHWDQELGDDGYYFAVESDLAVELADGRRVELPFLAELGDGSWLDQFDLSDDEQAAINALDTQEQADKWYAAQRLGVEAAVIEPMLRAIEFLIYQDATLGRVCLTAESEAIEATE